MMEKYRMDIDQELDQLILEYKIDRYNPAYCNFVRAKSLIKEMYIELQKVYKEIILVSDKWEDIGYFCDFAGEKCKYMFIENPVLPDLEIMSAFNGDECFLIVSLNYRDELVARLSEKVKMVLDLYDYFEDKGLFLEQNYYQIYPIGYHSFDLDQKTSDYTEFKAGVIFLNHRNRFEGTCDLSRKKKYLGKMIFDCVYNRDFLMLKECVGIYQDLDFNDSKDYVEFLEKVDALLLEIKQRMLERNVEDVVMYWLDALEYGDDSEMPFLRSLDETALCMDNMYTVTPTTHPTFRTLFAKRRVIEEQSYNLKVVTKEDSRLIQELEKRGYSFVCYGQWVKNEKNFRANRYVYKNADFTSVFWTFLKDVMLEPEKKFFAIIHELFNTHYPYFSFGYTDKFFTSTHYIPGMPEDTQRSKLERQRKEAQRYVDKYLEFYAGLLPGNALKLYMSDHGYTYYGKFHVVMKFQQDGIVPHRYDDMMSLFDFDKLMLGILDNKMVDDSLLGSEYVIVQDSEYRHYEYILNSINNLQIFEKNLLGYQGVITKEDMLICHREGVMYYPERHYRKFVNDGKIVTNDRMEYLKKLMSNKQVDLDSSDEFKYSRMVVNGIKKHFLRVKDEEDRRWPIINRTMIEAVDHGTVAIRGGGVHTERLLMLLDGKVRERIQYVIDYDKECIASYLGVQIILPDEIEKYGVDCVVISSFKYREIWKKEFESDAGLRVVDIYEELEKEGISSVRDFFYMNYIREDFV